MHMDLFRLGCSLDFSNCMAGHGAETAYAIVAAIIGPGIPILAWLILTYSYRQDKQMIIRETGKHVTEEDLGPGVITNPLSRTLSSASSSRGFGDPLIVTNPVLDQVRQVSGPSAVQQTARHIVVRSLRRWDAFLGFRASRDGLGTPLGVWRPKFDGVRFAVLLLAIRKMICIAGCLMEVWQSSSWAQQTTLLNQLAKLMHNISETEAQDLPHKDPDVPGLHDSLYTLLRWCCCRR